MSSQRVINLPGVRVPKSHRFVGAGAGQCVSIGRKRHRADHIGMSGEDAFLLSRMYVRQ